MASRPGLLTHWPWEKLGNFKSLSGLCLQYVILTPWVAHSLYTVAMANDWSEVDITYLINLPVLLLRMLHNQLWISYSRFQNARSRHRIVDKPIEFEQVDRESNWDDLILFNGILFYVSYNLIPIAKNLPWWRTDSLLIVIVAHAGPVEFLYYWFHRVLHHHYLYSRYHSHHHASIITEPITSVIHPFAEHIVYFLLFSIPLFTSIFMGKGSLITIIGYMLYIDFMNNLGHCNFELVPKWCFQVFPPLKYLMYTPSYHSLHHTQFRTNYSLFMPIYDYMYHTMDKSTDTLYENSVKGKDDIPHVVHLTHLTTLQSIYHLRLGFATLSSKPYSSKWYITLMCPVTWMTILLTWIISSSFIIERNNLKKIKMQTWVIPRFSFQYNLAWQREIINDLIKKSILEAEEKGIKVLSLGLNNMVKELNGGSELHIQNYPKLKLKIIDGSSLITALVLNNIPDGTKQVLLQGNPIKVALALAQALYKRGVQVMMTRKHEYHMLKSLLSESIKSNLTLSSNYNPQVWLIGDGLDDADQNKAPKGTHLIPFSQFPLKKVCKDCTYYTTPAMKIPAALENVHSCENWLPRRVMRASRITGIIHALEGWNTHECGDSMLDVEKIWSSALSHGFIPLTHI